MQMKQKYIVGASRKAAKSNHKKEYNMPAVRRQCNYKLTQLPRAKALAPKTIRHGLVSTRAKIGEVIRNFLSENRATCLQREKKIVTRRNAKKKRTKSQKYTGWYKKGNEK